MAQFLSNVYAALPGGIMLFIALMAWMALFDLEGQHYGRR